MNPVFIADLSFPFSEKGPYRFVDTRPESKQEPIIFLHGMLGDVSNWDQTIAAVHVEGYRAIAPILPVCSIKTKDANLNGLVRYIRGVLHELQIERCIFVGNSLGGHLAVLLTAQFPQVVSALVLTGSSGIFELDLGKSIMRRQDRDYVRKRVEKTFFNPTFCTERLLDNVISIINTRDSVLRLIRIARSIQGGNVREFLHEIEVPTLLIWGEQDRITPLEVAETFHIGINDSKLKVIDGCGHAPMLERPDSFQHHLLSFLEDVSVNESRAMAF